MHFPYSNMMQHVQITGHPRRLQIFFYPCFQQQFPTWHAIRRNFIVRISMRVSWFWNPVRLSIRMLNTWVGSDAATNVMAMVWMRIGTPYVFFASWILSDDSLKFGPIAIAAIAGGWPSGPASCCHWNWMSMFWRAPGVQIDSVRTSKAASIFSFFSIHFWCRLTHWPHSHPNIHCFPFFWRFWLLISHL